MSGFAALFDYAGEVLAFGFRAAGEAVAPPAAPEPAALARLLGRTLAAFERSGRGRLVLLGLGSGALAGALAETLPSGALVVCEQDLRLVRALRASGRLDWWQREGPAGLAADASAWALLLLLDRAGVGPAAPGPGEALVLPNPELPPAAKAVFKPLELLLTRSRPAEIPALAGPPRLSCAAILAPSEPDLPGFFAQFPDWIAELALVWDADAPPDLDLPVRFPVRQMARRLRGDFSAQRNAMLSACRDDWVLYLDADERLAPEAWAALPLLCATPGVSGWHFPRLSPYPSEDRALVGFGLWPDIQLRLFRNQPGLGFVNPVHERLAGLSGAQGLVLDLEIEHLGRLRKDAATLADKLAGFDAASGGGVRHVLSAEYPSLPRGLLAVQPSPGALATPRGLVLPPEQG